MALEIILERQREINRQMRESLRADHAALQHKARERSMLMIMKQEMMAKQAEKESLVHDFMVFIEAIGNDHVQVARNFDKKAMMNSILIKANYTCTHGGYTVYKGQLPLTIYNCFQPVILEMSVCVFTCSL
ncbi:hypothetical protein GQ457_02G031670 [Hibiscus cannabinus]